uniref:Putative secreted protein n=1 Tax=Anopheles marajoara TaxID=58244 RepID=A0A2M4CEH0_9DIPT
MLLLQLLGATPPTPLKLPFHCFWLMPLWWASCPSRTPHHQPRSHKLLFCALTRRETWTKRCEQEAGGGK